MRNNKSGKGSVLIQRFLSSSWLPLELRGGKTLVSYKNSGKTELWLWSIKCAYLLLQMTGFHWKWIRKGIVLSAENLRDTVSLERSGIRDPCILRLATRPVYASLQCIRFDHRIVILSSSILTSNTSLRSRNTGVQSCHTCSFMSPHVTDPRSWVLLKKQDWLWQEMGELDLEQAPATSLRATNTCCIRTINH